MLGFHQCHLCPHAPEDGARLRIRIGDRELFLDNGEVLVVGREGQAFRAPIMLYHYITVHYYRPLRFLGKPYESLSLARESKWRRRLIPSGLLGQSGCSNRLGK